MLQTHKALIEKDGKFLVLLRPKNCKRYPDSWDLPGGKSDENENHEQTLTREVREEIGLDILVTDKLYEFEIESECIPNAKARFFLHSATLSNSEAPILLSPEHTDYKWLTLAEIKHLKKREIVLDNYVRSLKK